VSQLGMPYRVMLAMARHHATRRGPLGDNP
jgi:hypothetical protein